MPLFTQGTREMTQLEQKVREYDKYIEEHRENVLKAFNKFSDKIITVLDEISIEEMIKKEQLANYSIIRKEKPMNVNIPKIRIDCKI